MSINWVMLSPTDSFVRLPSEQKLYASPARVSISIDSVNKFPGRQPFNLACAAGKVFLTNRRIIYIPTTPPPQTSNQAPPTVLASFAAPLSNVHDSRVTTPWLGPNAWVAAVQPVLGGGIPTHHPAVEVRMTFKDGGAYDFHARFAELRERLAQARENSSAANSASGNGAGGEEVVHLEQLPAYEDSGRDAAVSTARAGEPGRVRPSPPPAQQRPVQATVRGQPTEPPPGYEEAQRDGVADLLEGSLRLEERDR